MTRNITLVFSVVIHAFLWTVNKLTETIQHWTIFPVIKIMFHYKLHLSTFQMKKWKTNILSTLYSLFGWILAGHFDNPTSVNLHNSVHVLRIYTETISENIFNDKLDSCTKNVFSCFLLESEKLENNIYIGACGTSNYRNPVCKFAKFPFTEPIKWKTPSPAKLLIEWNSGRNK